MCDGPWWKALCSVMVSYESVAASAEESALTSLELYQSAMTFLDVIDNDPGCAAARLCNVACVLTSVLDI